LTDHLGAYRAGVKKEKKSTVKLKAFRHTYVGRPNKGHQQK